MVNIAVLIEDFHQCGTATADYIKKLRSKTSCDYLIALMSGDFCEAGPAPIDREMRTEWALAHGVDLVLEKPVYTTLCSPDLYAHSAISLLTKLRIRCTLCISTDGTDPDLLMQITKNLLVTDQRFKNNIYAQLKKGKTFREARAIVMEQSLPGAGNALLHQRNNYAVEYMKSMKYCYSPIVPLLIRDNRTMEIIAPYPGDLMLHNDDFSSLLYERLADPEFHPETIWGCTSTIARSIQKYLPGYTDFSTFAQQLSSGRHPQEEITQILHRMILRITHPEFTLFSLYDYALYAVVLGCGENAGELLSLIGHRSSIPLLTDNSDTKALLNQSAQTIRLLDQRATELHKYLKSKLKGLPVTDFLF